MKPTIGRIVHYVAVEEWEAAPVHRAAMVTVVRDDGTVDLCVHHPSGLEFRRAVKHSDLSPADPPWGTWHWPEKD